MKLKIVLTISIIAIMLSVAAYAITKISDSVVVADGVSLKEIEECETVYWNESEDVTGVCNNEIDEQICLDSPNNLSCHINKRTVSYDCITGKRIIARQMEFCETEKINLEIEKALSKDKYELAYGEWGKCSYLPGTSNVVIICDSNLDGNADGICQDGESCISFIVSKDSIARYMKNSRKDFVISDNTFTQKIIDLKVLQ